EQVGLPPEQPVQDSRRRVGHVWRRLVQCWIEGDGAGGMSLRSYTQPAMSPSAPSASVGRRRRVLLVHAHPVEWGARVPASGLERVRTAAEDAGAEVRLDDPYLVSEDPIETAREAALEFRPDLVGLGIRIIDDCIVVDRLDGDGPIDVSFLLPE